MHLSLSLQATQRLETILKMSPEMRMDLRMELAGRLGKSIADLLRRGNDAPEKLYDVVVARIVEILAALTKQREFALGVGERLSMTMVKQRSLQQQLFHAMPHNLQGYREFCADCLFDEAELSGGFQLGPDTLEIVKTTRGVLHTAVSKPDELTQSIEFYLERIREAKDQDTTALLLHLNEAQAAKKVLEVHGPRIDNLAQIYAQAVSPATDVVDGRAIRLFHQLFRDLVVHDRLTLRVGEAMQRRFGQSVLDAEADEEAVRAALLDVLGSYVLAGMGIVTPDQYADSGRRGQRSDDEDVRTQWKLLGSDGEREVVSHWETGSGQLFLPRWSTTQRLAKRIVISRQQVADFLAQTVGRDAEELTRILDIEELARKSEEIVHAEGAKKTKRVMLEELLVDTLDDERVTTALSDRIRGHWYDALHVFLEREESATRVG